MASSKANSLKKSKLHSHSYWLGGGGGGVKYIYDFRQEIGQPKFDNVSHTNVFVTGTSKVTITHEYYECTQERMSFFTHITRYVISPFHPSFDRKESHTTQWTLNSTYLGWEGLIYTFKPKSLFLCDYRTKSDGVFAEMQTISYSFIILMHIYSD